MMLASQPTVGVRVAVFVERVPGMTNARSCRDYIWAKVLKGQSAILNIILFEKEPFALVRWTKKEFQGRQVTLQTVKKFFGRDGICVDVDVQKAAYTAADAPLLEQLLDTAKIRER